ncbi:hypothetical protein GF377_03430, partial [candidate division GN15 bacterium]|nr:hypothetical protein [candidate division GN15 bacterium]
RHVLHHELTHAMTYDMLYGNNFASILSRQRLFNMPLWLAEGFAEYSSRHGWDYQADMFVRDATINGYLAPPLYLGGFLAYKQGQAMIKFIADKYGEDKVGELFKKGKIYLSMNRTLKAVIGKDEEEFFQEFSKEMKRRYWPSIAERKDVDEVSLRLTEAREDGSYFNEKPVFSPEGDRIAMFTDRFDYTEIVLIDALTGDVSKRLVKSQRSGDLESLHSFVSGVSWSPDGRNLVFVAKSGGKDALFFLDVRDEDVYHRERLDYYNIVNPAWSPDGRKVAFAALDDHKRNLFVYDIESREITEITDDRFDDVEPSWTPDSETLVFASDRPHPQNPVLDNVGHPYVATEGALMPGDFEYGTYNLFRLDVDTRRIEPVDVGPGQNRYPQVSPDGKKVAFVSNRNGIDNIYVGYLDSTRHFAVTDINTGIRSISWGPKGDRLAYSAFFKGAFDIFILDDLAPAGEDGVLAKTDYVLGKYDLLSTGEEEPVEETDPSDQTTGEADEVAGADNSEESDAAESGPEAETSAELADADAEISTDETAESPSDTTTVAASEGTAVDTTDTVTVADAGGKSEGDTEGDKQSGGDDAAEGESSDSTEAVTETGIYEDEYVYVSSGDESVMESVLTDVPADTGFGDVEQGESEIFDSIPPLLPSGEYEVKDYKVKFTPDFVGGGFAYDTFFGVRGQTYFVFSDYLGNHNIYLATDIVNSIDQSYIQAFYFNNKNRWRWGGGFFHSKNFYIDSRDFLFSDRFYGIQAFAERPFSVFSRLEFSASQFFIDREYIDVFDTREDRSSKVTTASTAWVFDNVLWGRTAPVNGTRWKLSVDGGINLFDSDDIEFYSVGLDYRKYWHIAKTASMAFRVSGGASFGETPKQYFLGGTTNWIGTRTLDAKVYEVENLYFADVVTPLRGEEYYGLSGDRYALVNWEFRFPTIQVLALRYPLPLVLSNVTGAVFTDMGAAWFGDDFKFGTSDGGNSRLVDVKTGFGVGLRLNLFGFALLRYDLAWSTDFYKVSDKPTSYFSFGADF